MRLREQGYANGPNDLVEGVPLLTRLVSETLNVRLPEGARLAALPDAARRNEMEFHFALAPTRTQAVLELLHRFGIVADRQAFGLRQRLEGLLTGRIDLVYEVAGRYYLLDYKSNQLRSYDGNRLPRRCATASTTCSTCSTAWRCIAGCASGWAPATTSGGTWAGSATCSAAASTRSANTPRESTRSRCRRR